MKKNCCVRRKPKRKKRRSVADQIVDRVNAKITKGVNKIMSAISQYSQVVEQKYNEIGESVDSIVKSQEGITKDVADLKAIIDRLQNNPGPISAEDQQLLDKGVEQINALSEKTRAVAAALKSLDEATETAPEVPEEGGGEEQPPAEEGSETTQPE